MSLVELREMPAIMIPAPVRASFMIMRLLVSLRLNLQNESKTKTTKVWATSGISPNNIKYCTT